MLFNRPRLSSRSARVLSRTIIETLETRRLLCAEIHTYSPALLEAPIMANGLVNPGYDVLARYDSDGDGHLTREQFETLLTADERERFDPHFIIDQNPEFGPGTFPPVLRSAGGPEADALPDMYPVIGSFSNDTTTQTGKNLIRFSTTINNMGAGPAILISGSAGQQVPAGAPITSWVNANGSQNVLQAIYQYNSGNNTFSLVRYELAGTFTYHAAHSHLHFDGYATYKLKTTTGQPVYRTTGEEVVGEKIGFCLINVNSSFTLPGGGSSTSLPGYSAAQPSTGCGFTQGVHVGKGDVYGSSLEGQWIDVTGVPNGNYRLEVVVNAVGYDSNGTTGVRESNLANNLVNIPITVNFGSMGSGIQPDVYDTGTNNNTMATATNLGVMGRANFPGLTIHSSADKDWFRFEASSTASNQQVQLIYTNGDVNLYVYDGNGNLLGLSSSPTTGSTTSPVTETVTFSTVKGQTYYVMADSFSSGLSNNYEIRYFVKPQVEFGFMEYNRNPSINEDGTSQRAFFTIKRNGPTEIALTVPLVVGGTATAGVDYSALPASVTFDAVTSEIIVPITVFNDSLVEGNETITITVGGSSNYVIGSSMATLTIIDDDFATRPGNGGGDSRGGLLRWGGSAAVPAMTSPFQATRLIAGGDDLLDSGAPVLPK